MGSNKAQRCSHGCLAINIPDRDTNPQSHSLEPLSLNLPELASPFSLYDRLQNTLSANPRTGSIETLSLSKGYTLQLIPGLGRSGEWGTWHGRMDIAEVTSAGRAKQQRRRPGSSAHLTPK